MRPFAKYSSTARFLCASTAKKSCSLEEICSLGGFSGGTPNQWFRFIIPIFLHGGVVHLLLNLLFQVGAGRRIEEDMGSMRYFLLYMISGLVGNVLGANFAPTNQRGELTKMLLMIAFSFAMGLLPGFDNFAHIGGFLGGFIGSFLLLPRINFGKWDRRLKFAAMLIAVPILVTLFALLLANFYGTIFPADSCRWCRYLSCLPVAGELPLNFVAVRRTRGAHSARDIGEYANRTDKFLR
ncbi:MAG: hypothetical protein BJ554DRAFT_3252 [Olpidium bornovanus]|uniref:Peptidase S54 rhomboid domain-containing protein n=1 Tax=Olpidium bornovanus TaxID=278681 RepID=A0A8H8DG22_9FUNG|nr:MAG: hypothetical protein BJ554DRAFT_3252 [Olpidium bornovanus]